MRHNFIIGTKCPHNERYWRGIVGNLNEELGGKGGLSHNELYRRFLRSVGGASESDLKEPAFARELNSSWESYIQEMDVEECLYAIAIYEVLDNPDYKMLLMLLKSHGELNMDLSFFAVHAAADHRSLFAEFLHETSVSYMRKEWEHKAAEFVFSTQENMWNGLISELSQGCL